MKTMNELEDVTWKCLEAKMLEGKWSWFLDGRMVEGNLLDYHTTVDMLSMMEYLDGVGYLEEWLFMKEFQWKASWERDSEMSRSKEFRRRSWENTVVLEEVSIREVMLLKENGSVRRMVVVENLDYYNSNVVEEHRSIKYLTPTVINPYGYWVNYCSCAWANDNKICYYSSRFMSYLKDNLGHTNFSFRRMFQRMLDESRRHPEEELMEHLDAITL